MNRALILRRPVDALIHVIHIDLIHHTHMSHSLCHHRVHFCLHVLVLLTRLLEIGMREELIARHIVGSELKHVPSLVLRVGPRLITRLRLLSSLHSSCVNHRI